MTHSVLSFGTTTHPLSEKGEKKKNLTIVTDQCQRQTPCREGSCSSSGAAMLAIQTHTHARELQMPAMQPSRSAHAACVTCA